MSLDGNTALVTGGGRGIGAAAAVALAEAGAAVAVAARTEAQVEDVAAELRAKGHEALAYRCDVTDPKAVRELAMSAREALGRIDILVNNAGTATSNRLGSIELDEWNRIMAVNATGTFLCTQAVFDQMKQQRWGRIVNVASIAGLEGAKYISAYSAAKHAVVGFTKSVAMEAEGTGVTVNAVCPGYVDTPLTDQTIERIMERSGLSWDESRDAILEASGQPRLIRVDEVAEVIVGLCGEGSDERNGEMVILDGKQAI